MDRGIRLPEEQPSECDSIGKGDVLPITYKPFEYDDLSRTRMIVIDYWRDVNSENLSGSAEFDFNGKRVTLLRSDEKVLQFHETGIKIQLALVNNTDVVGMLLYRVAFECVMAIEGMYVYPEFRRNGIGRELINSVEKPIKKIMFQTRVLRKPSLMFGALKSMGIEPKKVYFKDNKVTWEAEWK